MNGGNDWALHHSSDKSLAELAAVKVLDRCIVPLASIDKLPSGK